MAASPSLSELACSWRKSGRSASAAGRSDLLERHDHLAFGCVTPLWRPLLSADWRGYRRKRQSNVGWRDMPRLRLPP
jgi:hypothetical protein